tara:strand:+ start:38133 stop:38648 length:516 start_codon:yes stop_codon:yes gene_type:complete
MINKKGSLSLSINAIIVIVIAFIFLGIAIGFIKGQLGSSEETFSDVQGQVKQKIIEDLRTSNKKLSFPTQTITLEKGDSKDIAIGVKNTGGGPLDFTIVVTTEDSQGGSSFPDAIDYFHDKGSQQLKGKESEAYNIKITAKGDPDTYLVKLKIDDGTPNGYATKSFFITIV